LSDASLLGTVLRNLVDNAIKYTERGGVLVGCRRRGDKLRFEVWDTGPGIAQDQQELIFQDFYQIDNEARRRTQGLGLGLSIVRRMTAILGCDLGCRSREGQGAVFWVEAPLLAPQSPAPASAPSRTLEHGGGHIAIIDDDEQVLAGLKSLLENAGYTIQALTSAKPGYLRTALSECRTMPEMVVADYRLDGTLTGGDAIRSIRDILGADVPAIIITGDTAPERLREAKQSGFPILHKPVNPEELMALIHRGLRATDGV
ncbi:MAG: response regulator, partial [Alphaproteobacteria bacterium]|nr:response regulator [Alphaproteobacteria bacterium]